MIEDVFAVVRVMFVAFGAAAIFLGICIFAAWWLYAIAVMIGTGS